MKWKQREYKLYVKIRALLEISATTNNREYRTVSKLKLLFKASREKLQDDPHLGSTITSFTEANIQRNAHNTRMLFE